MGGFPQSLALGDFDSDGYLDLAAANQSSGNVSILLGNGDGTFQEQSILPSGAHPSWVGTVDTDSDGVLDLLVVSTALNELWVHPGCGDGTFGPGSRLAVGASPVFGAIADLNGDTLQDVAVANEGSNDISIFLGDRQLGWVAVARVSVGTSPVSLAPGDFDSDGNPDLVTANVDSHDVSILLGHGNGTFAQELRYSIGNFPVHVSVGDLNQDLDPDLVVSNRDQSFVSVGLGDGGSSFSPEVRLSSVFRPVGTVVEDVNGDGNLDIVAASGSLLHVSVHLGTGSGDFAPSTRLGPGPVHSAIVAGDLDGDGTSDLILANAGNNDVSVHLGVGDGSFVSALEFPLTLSPGVEQRVESDLLAGLFDADLLPDLAVVVGPVGAFVEGAVALLEGLGDGRFSSAGRSRVGYLPRSPAAGDFNGDQRLDLVVPNHGSDDVSILYSHPFGALVSQRLVTAGDGPFAAASGDFNVDGHDDFAITNAISSTITIHLGDGHLNFDLAQQLSAAPGPFRAGDFNDDGLEDLAVLRSGQTTESSNKVVIYHGDGRGAFSPASALPLESPPSSLTVGDFNGDRIFDLAVASTIGNSISVFLGDVGNGLSLSHHLLQVAGAGPIATTDVNGDQINDLLVSADLGHIEVFLGNPSGEFAEGGRYAVGLRASSITTGDFNGDLRQDLALVVQGGGKAFVLLNQLTRPENAPPVAVAGSNQTLPCVGGGVATVTLDGSLSADLDSLLGTNSDIVSFEWFENFNRADERALGTDATVQLTLALGFHRVFLKVVDSSGAVGVDEVIVSVIEADSDGLCGVGSVPSFVEKGKRRNLLLTKQIA